MAKLTEVGAWLEQRLPELLSEHKVPGAAVAVMAGDEVIDTAAGVLSKATGVDATADSLFQVGSITKVWTATLLMQLVDDGKVDLDATVRTYLPDFAIGDDDAAKTITVRQLMCHVAGFEGDIFTDTGTGDDCVEKYVATLSDVPQLFPPGEMFSYNNAGYCVLGRIVEVAREKPFDHCVRDHLFTPLQLKYAANGPYEAILYRAAVGHIQPTPDADPEPAPMWALVRSNAPAGAMLAMRPRDLLAFARMHLDGGTGPDGNQVLSPASVKAMQERQVELPDLGLMGNAWGLGWEIFDLEGGTVIGHDGGTIGQNAFLRMVPGRDVAVALCANGGNPMPLYTEIVGRVLHELGGVDLPALPAPQAEPPAVDGSRYVGTYSSTVSDSTVSVDDGGRIWLDSTPKGIAKELGASPERTELVGWRGDTLLPIEPDHGLHMPHAFVGDDGDGHTAYLHTGRADRRVAS
ncbi:serine hydrolase domain-containing protein [Solicola gregarius]|uniref:Beta-lactamase family protein n=1 Tax=Solicola gregarius TaxID=2908642 RepID=A0AA46TL39_9ACTN|nr:serine hydrolase domain-containing protein [Solicola gregarius]UYM06902.1 beta-lactamase family protein [Solicola gregarius]